jgi:hypothetical protein
MAEFKLGRIRFVWQGDWSAGRSYVADDVVSFGGKSYICILNHTSSTEFQTDFDAALRKWDIVSDGTSWKGDWTPSTAFAPGDVVRYGAIVYIAETGHTSATFEAPDYLGLEEDLDKWTEFATSFDWKSEWTVGTRYKINDLVRYGGYVYVCNTAHVSAATLALGLEQDQAKWTLFSDGIVYTGDWVTATRYRVNDVVKYGGNIYIATAAHTSSDFASDTANWDVFIEGFQFEDSWNNSTTYQSGDTITYGGYVYVAKRTNTNAQPTTSPDDWEVFTTGFSFQGDWSALDSYKPGDVVRLGGNTYVAIADTTDNEPPDDTYWSRLNSGINWTQSTENFSQIAGTNASGGSGNGARFDVIKSKTVYTVSVSTGFTGSGYADNDVITISGADVGGTTPANDIVVTVTGQTAGAIDTITHTGYSSSWIASRDYAVGDVVLYGASSFICTVKHTSETANRPDNDTTAQYWNILTIGSEALALEVEGDLVYYGNQGPTRLPIGVDGQILRATDGFPDWANYGLIDNVVYCGPLGTDTPAPASGLTIDKPFKSLRFALDQIRNGYLNPQTRDILRNNKQFLIKESTAWVKHNYKVNITASTAGSRVFTCDTTANLSDGLPIVFSGEAIGGVTLGTTYYVDSIVSATTFRIAETPGAISFIPTDDTGTMTGNASVDFADLEKDCGAIIDGLIYDISRGGTLKTTEVTNSYYTSAGNEYVNSTQRNQRVINEEVYTQLKSFVADVLNNEAPVNYQALNGVPVEERAQQIIDFNLTAESVGKTKAGDLLDICVNGIAAQSNTAIALAVLPNTTVFIKTGTYNEVLPMILPEYTAVVGDELRTSVVQPQPAIAKLKNDKNKTTSALNRIKAVSADIVQNIKITPTTGNTVEQQYINGYGGTTTSTNRLNNSIEAFSDVVEFGLDYAPTMPAVGPTPTSGSNNASDSGFANAVAQIEANYEFLKAEIIAWTNNEIATDSAPFVNSFTYDADKWTEYFEYTLDALRYDITYGGNLETTEMSRSFFVNGSPIYASGEKEELLAAYAQFKTIVGDIITETTVTPTTGNDLTQDTDGTAGSAGAETYAEARVQEIYDTIDTDGTLPTGIAPDITWTDGVVQSIVTDFTTVKSSIQTGSTTEINTEYSDLSYNSTNSERDIGYLIDALEYDVLFGSTFRGLKAGMAYRVEPTSRELTVDDELEPLLAATDYTRDRIKFYTVRTSKVKDTTDLLVDIMTNGSGSIPTSYTSTDPSGYDTGFSNARRLIVANKDFIVAEIEAYMTDQYNAFWTGLDSDSKADWLVDVEDQVEALRYDLTYRGNLATRIQARVFYNSSGAFVRGASEKTESLASQQRLINIINDIAQGNGITKTTGNAETQDTSGTGGSSGAGLFAQDRLQEIYNQMDTNVEPALISPSLTYTDDALEALKGVLDARSSVWQNATVDYLNKEYTSATFVTDNLKRDVGYLIDAIGYDTVLDSNYLIVQIAKAYRRRATVADLEFTDSLVEDLAVVNFIDAFVQEITNGVTSTPGNRLASERAYELVNDMNTIIQNGLEALPPSEFPAPTGHNTSALVDTAYATTSNTTGVTTTYGDAAAQIVANHAFIKDEVRHWLEDATNGYDTIWNSISADGQDRCIRDVGYILDAARYDLLYGGNTQSIVAGNAYFSNFVLTISSSELPATIAAYGRLKTVVGEVIAETSVTTSPGVTEVQDTSGTVGNAASIEFAQARIQDVLDHIQNSTANATIEIAKNWQQKETTAAYNRIVDRKSEIVEDVVFWVEKFHQELSYNQDTCRRDVQLMVDALARDLYTGSNFATTKAGMSYYRLIPSAQKTVRDELYATVGSVKFLAQKVKRLTVITATASTELLIEDITAYINGGETPVDKWVAPSDVDVNDVAAGSIIYENKEYIKEEVIAFLDENYPSVSYDKDKCKRDVGFLVDALRYDMTYDSNYASLKFAESYYYKNENNEQILQISESEKTATLAAYDYMKLIVNGLAVNSAASPGAIQTDVEPVLRDSLQPIGDSNSQAKTESLMTNVYNVINDILTGPQFIVDSTDGSTETFTSTTAHNLRVGDEVVFAEGSFEDYDKYYVKTVPSSTTFTLSAYFNGPTFDVDTNTEINAVAYYYNTASITDVSGTLKQQFTNLTGSLSAIKTAITTFIADKYPTLTYNVDKCERDVGYIVEAVGRDMLNNTNYLTNIAALSYYRGTQADKVLGEQKNATVQSYRELKNVIASYTTGSTYATTNQNRLMDIIINMLDKGNGDTPEIHGTVTYYNDRETINAVDTLKANKNFLANEATAHIEQSFGGTVTDIAGSPGTITFSAAHNLIVGDPIVFDSNAFGDLVAGTTYYVSTVVSTTEIEIAATDGGVSLVLDPATGSSVATYDFDRAACRRDMEAYIDAIVYDLQYPGNSRSWKAAELYLNAVNGSERSDMYHVRNATGVRNQTVNGLRGNLTEENVNGTRRPTAGSYVSLDPGFGPNDTEAWVTNKSCYVQNVTTFGVGCVGCKIDGALHAGGNRSIVSNDFTQVLSDGIGVWCSGNNSLTELVSVFAYYNYSGYLADFGGRIRATNGNSSYGTYGVIAEGTDTGEVPITATVNNLSQDALVFSALTDGEDEVLAFEFSNAGRDYTNAEFAISGTGFNAAVNDTEFRDQAVVETRIIDLNDGNGIGGEDYVTAQNVAQGGDKVSVTLAATDFALGGAYNGMNVQLTAGTGVGQYGTILTFNNGTKLATVYKDSFENLTITATTATGNLITVADTTTLYVNMPIYLSADVGGLTAATVYYITAISSGTQFTVSTSEGGANATLTTTTGQSVTLYAAGWDHVIQGTTISNSLDLTTGYTVDPKVKYSEPGWNVVTTPTTATSADFASMIYADDKFVALPGAGTDTNYSLDGITWTAGGALPTSGDWNAVTYGGGTGATATAVVGGLGGQGAVLTAQLGELNSIGLPGPTQIKSVTVVDGGRGYITAPTIVFTPTAGGGGASGVATVKDGIIQEVIITSTGAGYSSAPTVTAATDRVTEVIVNSFGNNYLTVPTVTITGGGASTQATVSATTNNNGVATITIDNDGNGDPLNGAGYTSQPTVSITDSAAKIVAIRNGSTDNANLALSAADNAAWSAGNALPSSAYEDIAYGNGVYVVVGSTGGSGGAATSTDGSTWVSRTITSPAAGTFTSIAYGATKFVAITTNGASAYSSNGITWTAGGSLPGSSTDWTDMEFGNGRFVAISSSGDYAISIDEGANWITLGNTLESMFNTGWTGVQYGQGLFVAHRGSTSDWASSQDGIHWTPRLEAGTQTYDAFAFGNPNNVPIWAAASNGADTNAAYIKTGARTLGRAYVEDDSVTTVTMREPGSGYPIGSLASTSGTNTITLSAADPRLFLNQPITFEGASDAGLDSETLYYIRAISGADIEVGLLAGGASFDITVVADLSSATFAAGPQVTITDSNATVDVAVNPRIRNGALGNPVFTNRGTGYTTATCELGGDGSADLYQPSTFIAVKDLFELPEPGSNVVFGNISNTWYKLVTISNVIGQAGDYTATFQISPGLTTLNAPKHETTVTTTNKYSQVRLTGHDFLYIGTGNQAKTNYPFVDITTASIAAQQLSSGGGRVFFTSTDQDGNFNVGNLFGVQQSTGTATLDADAFNLAGLQSLQLGGIAVGIGSAVITQFSTDPFFTENSDSIVPTQRAIKSYITAQIGGGQSSLNVNTLTAGVVFIANDEITTTSGGQLNIKAKMNFTGGIDGAPVALGYFLSR